MTFDQKWISRSALCRSPRTPSQSAAAEWYRRRTGARVRLIAGYADKKHLMRTRSTCVPAVRSER